MVRFTPFGAALAALVVAGSVQAEPPRKKVSSPQPSVHQMELFNGPSRTVRNFALGYLSTSEVASLGDLERLENEAAFAQDVQALKHQYVLSERLLETHRRVVQQELYGRATSRTNYDPLTSRIDYDSSFDRLGGVGFGFGSPFNRVGGFGFGFARPAAYSTAYSGDRVTETRSLADGVGGEGALKASLAVVIAKQAVPSYAASISQDYRQAAMIAATSPRLQAALRLPTIEDIRKENNAIRAAEFESPLANRVTLTLADGKKVIGTDLEEGKEWVTIKRLDGGKSRFRLSQVLQIDEPNNGGKNKPAIDE